MVGWHPQLDGRGFDKTQGDSEGQGSMVWCRSWGHRESEMI